MSEEATATKYAALVVFHVTGCISPIQLGPFDDEAAAEAAASEMERGGALVFKTFVYPLAIPPEPITVAVRGDATEEDERSV